MRKNTTAAALAKRLGVNIKTVYKYTAVPRAEYEAKSLASSKPWKALGMSRATWYRKGKPNAKTSCVEPPTQTSAN
jgi:adenine/guanine phosphoribosyltransferase-like PRPP-binding protein